MTLLDPRSIRRIAAELDLMPTKKLGQNFVHDPNTVRRIVSLAGISPADRVLEIGPGLGSLTLGLLEKAGSVVAVEIDQKLAGRLYETVSEYSPERAGNLTVLTEDALNLDQLPGDEPTALVANLPYNVSVPVLLNLLEKFSWENGLVMVQAEVADRLAAKPGSKIYGIPSIKAAWYADVQLVGSVPNNVFWPIPNVGSKLVKLSRHAELGDSTLRRQVFQLIDAAFSQRRKMLRQSLATELRKLDLGSTPVEILNLAGIDPTLRGENLTVQDFIALAKIVQAM